ncbi:plasmid replication initiator TrfA [Pseudomonas sp. TMP25]|uniref:plasmid replication initiator TrfA n=1 Tax=Pseudomonas sp. TMP25 TaxID=3136561 RepID=UPI0031013CA5
MKDLVSDMGWPKNGRYYEKARECISRLKASEVLVHNEKAYGSSGAISLIDKYAVVNDKNGSPTDYRVLIDKNLIVLFAGSTFTNHSWDVYRGLSPVARRLADYIESHKSPFPLSLVRFAEMCGSTDRASFSWTQTVKKACAEIEAGGIAKQSTVQKGFIYSVK